MSVHLENGTPWDYGLEMLDLVVRSDECVDEEGGTDDGKVEGEKQNYEGKEGHGGCTGWVGRMVDRSSGMSTALKYVGWAQERIQQRSNRIWRG